MPSKKLALTDPGIDNLIREIRGQKVILDSDLAALYGVTTKALNQAVKRNSLRFPSDFMFQLTKAEHEKMRSQIVTTSKRRGLWRSQFVTSSSRGGARYFPYAFTEQGVAMLSSVLRSPRAIQVNVAIIRAFVRLREMLMSNADLARKLLALENKYDTQFRVVFDAIRELMEGPPPPPKPRIGFRP
jgi:ORF6N domain-containing protein